MSDLREQLAALRGNVSDARVQREDKDRIYRHEQFTGPHIEEAAELTEARRKLDNRVPGAPSPESVRELEAALASRITQDPDIGITPREAFGKLTFQLVSRKAARELREAQDAERAAGQAVAAFLTEHGDELQRLADEQDKQAVSDAIGSGSVERIREVLGLKGKALTTADLLAG
jgi:hypothetical protein